MTDHRHGRIIRLEAAIYRGIRAEIVRHCEQEHDGSAEEILDHESRFFDAGGAVYRDLANSLLEALE